MLITNLYLFLMALVLAVLEIQIEGKNGWAKNLPTWRPSANKWYTKLYSAILSGKELTGYHLAMFTFVFLIFNLPYVFNLPLTWENWLKTLSLFFIFIMVWDFLWFVINPNYPLKRFGKEDKINHLKWVWRIPNDYLLSCGLSFLLILPIVYLNQTWNIVYWWTQSVGTFALLTLLSVLVGLYFSKSKNILKYIGH